MAIITRQDHRFSAHPLIFMQSDRSLASALEDLMCDQRSYMRENVKLGQPAPGTLTLAEWSTPFHYRRLTQRYSDYLYRHHPDVPQEAKPLQSLWAQWYFGLLLPPLMLALLQEPRALDCSPQRIHVEFHENGHPCAFWIDVQEDEDARYLTPQQRIERLIQHSLIPAVNGMAQHGDINARLIWNNRLLVLLVPRRTAAAAACGYPASTGTGAVFSKSLSDGSDNPLYRTMIPRNGAMERRSCCQRYRIPDVERCGNCTLNAV